MRGTNFGRGAAPLLGALLCLLPAADAAGQRITGVVLDRTSGTAVGLALVALVDQGGTVRRQVLATDAGTFVLTAPGAGTYHLRVERIGYETFDAPQFQLASGADRHFRLEIDARPIALAGIEARGEQTCAINRSAGEILRVWTEARKVLASATLAEQQNVFSFTGISYTRRLSTDSAMLDQDVRRYSGAGRQPYTTLPAEDLTSRGYVRREGAAQIYWGPTADVLLSHEFESANCFSLTRDAAAPDLIGVRFTPNRQQRVPAIAGVVWLDAQTSQLRFVEFGYANVATFAYASSASGRVEFRMLPNGGWLVSRWWIRMPSGVRTLRSGVRVRETVSEFTEEGGEVHAVGTGTARWSLREPGAVAGAVFDSTTSRPLADATVTLAGTVLHGRTDDAGRFRITDVPEGRYTLTLQHPRLDSLPAYDAEPTVVDVYASRTADAAIAVPPLERSVLAVCDPVRGRTPVHGTIRDAATGRPLPDARIVLAWDSVIVNELVMGSARREREIRPDSHGRWFTCDVPLDSRIGASVEIDGRAVLRTEFRTDRTPTFHAFIVTAPPSGPPAATDRFTRWTPPARR